ncbi:unnamed protein product [Ceratitis capitata]|uniref:(Mediterranean fruit fly) hypothetical protein n=1 Tax=Ceratitis capitata TaxID=7213 RepID=A0A811U8G9_CERCA|nr:unnamed protein product [Ceratitis capitata]
MTTTAAATTAAPTVRRVNRGGHVWLIFGKTSKEMDGCANVTLKIVEVRGMPQNHLCPTVATVAMLHCRLLTMTMTVHDGKGIRFNHMRHLGAPASPSFGVAHN